MPRAVPRRDSNGSPCATIRIPGIRARFRKERGTTTKTRKTTNFGSRRWRLRWSPHSHHRSTSPPRARFVSERRSSSTGPPVWANAAPSPRRRRRSARRLCPCRATNSSPRGANDDSPPPSTPRSKPPPRTHRSFSTSVGSARSRAPRPPGRRRRRRRSRGNFGRRGGCGRRAVDSKGNRGVVGGFVLGHLGRPRRRRGPRGVGTTRSSPCGRRTAAGGDGTGREGFGRPRRGRRGSRERSRTASKVFHARGGGDAAHGGGASRDPSRVPRSRTRTVGPGRRDGRRERNAEIGGGEVGGEVGGSDAEDARDAGNAGDAGDAAYARFFGSSRDVAGDVPSRHRAFVIPRPRLSRLSRDASRVDVVASSVFGSGPRIRRRVFVRGVSPRRSRAGRGGGFVGTSRHPNHEREPRGRRSMVRA